MSARRKVKAILYFPLIVPLLIAYLFSKNKVLIAQDANSYIRKSNCTKSLYSLLLNRKDFRSVFYSRLGSVSFCLRFLLPSISSCELGLLKNVGGGLYLIHGFGTVTNPHAIIGKN